MLAMDLNDTIRPQLAAGAATLLEIFRELLAQIRGECQTDHDSNAMTALALRLTRDTHFACHHNDAIIH